MLKAEDVGSRSWGNRGKRIICTPSFPSLGPENFFSDDFQGFINGVNGSKAADFTLAERRWCGRKGMSSARVEEGVFEGRGSAGVITAGAGTTKLAWS